MNSIKKRFNSLYVQHFLLTAGMVLLAMLLLGIAFFTISYSNSVQEKKDEMREQAKSIALLLEDSLKNTADAGESEEETFQMIASMSAQVMNTNYLICATDGTILISTDKGLSPDAVTIPREITDFIVNGNGEYEGRVELGTDNEKSFVVGISIRNQSGQVIGFICSVMDNSELAGVWHSFSGMFIVTSGIILLIAFIASFLMTMHQMQPINEMVKATRAYAEGNFDIRMPEDSERYDEIGELATSFNHMADSLAETERQRRDFIANVSHELKTPMTTIAGYTDGILDGTIPPEKERQYLQIISDESRRLSRLVRRMLDISRLQSQEMKKVEFDICESMRIALLSMERKITDRDLDVNADIPEEPVMVSGDNELITQVVYNLLENATKFAAPKSLLYLGLKIQGEKAIITVQNEGNTIPAEEIPLLFERFHKSDKSRSEDKDGYGLGLYVVKTILDQHKEKISVTSENGLTSFSFTMQLTRIQTTERN